MKVAIAGYGLEGKASFDYWHQHGDDVTIADERGLIDAPEGAETILGPDAFSRLGDFDMVVRSAGVAPRKIATNGKIWSATNEFFAKCPAPIIGVTGTKGKGTTSSLIASILKAAGKTVHLVGNIGMPALEVLPSIKPDDIVVYELSSFQLWDVEKSPHVAVVLPIEPDHLDVHDSMIDYIGAKTRIVAYQSSNDVVVFNKDNRAATAIGEVSRARKILYPFDVAEFAGSLKLPGRHNFENAAAAIAAVGEYVTDPEQIRAGLSGFSGLPHRLKFVAEKNGVKYYDDSFSSATPATIVAAQAFKAPKILIVGGYDRGIDYTNFAKELASVSQLKYVIAIGQTGDKITAALQEAGFNNVTRSHAGMMPEIIGEAMSRAIFGDCIILSPGCASFDMFKNFTDRGEQFIAAVEAL